MSRRARSLSTLGLSVLCAGLAASLVDRYAADVRAQVGPLVSVVVAGKDIPRGKTLLPTNVSAYLSKRRVPARFVPPDALRLPADGVGLRARVRMPAGTYVGAAQLGPLDRSPAAGSQQDLARGARVAQVAVAGADALRGVLEPGVRVDVLITSERGPGSPRTYLALQRIELVDFRPAGEGGVSAEGDAPPADGLATLRVTLRQAVMLTAAQNFARELRLVPRAAGDARLADPVAVTAGGLRP